MKIVCSRQVFIERTNRRTFAFLELLSEPKKDSRIDLGSFNDLHSNLQKIGINTSLDYVFGNWYGNSSKSGYETFLDVTHNISDLIEGFELNVIMHPVSTQEI